MSWLEKDQKSGSSFPWNKRWQWQEEKTARRAIRSFSFTEKVIWYLLIAVFAASSFYILSEISRAFMVEVPQKGGTLTEGIIGSPRFINPLFAETDADRDLTSLIYSGLLRPSPEGGLVNDLSESYKISSDGKVYTFKLKNNIYFHDGEKVTAEDVEFTILKTQDPTLKSPKRINWEGVMVEVLNEREISFTLNQPYAPFLENTTLGILPKHLWKNLEPEQFPASLLNIEPVGSGPYEMNKIKRGSDGLPIFYQLKSFDEYSLGEPYIKNLTIKMFSNEQELIEALEKREIESVNSLPPSVVPSLVEKIGELDIHSVTLPKIFTVFFNQNQASIFTNTEVRRALSVALNKRRFVEEILNGFGSEMNSPIPKIYLDGEKSESDEFISGDLDEARAILERNGWQKNKETGLWQKGDEVLKFSISTHDIEDLKLSAQILKEQWEELGAEVEIKLFERSDFIQNIIRPRRYDALLFGTIVGRDLDLFPFWHSSNRNDPGLNVASYANIEADKLLEEARILNDKKERMEKYREFEEIMKEDYPAVFIYSPEFIYLMPIKIKNLKLGHITSVDNRFGNIHQWFIETNKIWKIFE